MFLYDGLEIPHFSLIPVLGKVDKVSHGDASNGDVAPKDVLKSVQSMLLVDLDARILQPTTILIRDRQKLKYSGKIELRIEISRKL